MKLTGTSAPHIIRACRLLLVAAAVGGGVNLSAQSSQVNLDKVLVVQPIFLQNGPGGNIAVQSNYLSQLPLFEQAAQKVYAQAGVRIVWNSPVTFVNSTNYTINTFNQVDSLVAAYGGGLGSPLNVFFTGPNATYNGVSQQSANVDKSFSSNVDYKNGSTISESVFNSGSGHFSLLTLPHEMGHSLGLDHDAILSATEPSGYNYPASVSYSGTELAQGSNNLMYAYQSAYGVAALGSIWSPSSTSGYGVLTSNQIEMLRLNPLLQPSSGYSYNYATGSVSAVPEPSTYAVALSALAGLYTIRRRWKAKRASGF